MRFSKAVVRGRVAILILTVILMIPAVFGMLETRINYDMLNYLPDDMDTVIGQNALLEDFGKGAFSFIVVENMPEKDVAALQEKLESVEHVETVLWYNSLMDTSIPMQLLPDKLYDAFNTGDATMMAVFFDTATSADETMDAIREIRSMARPLPIRPSRPNLGTKSPKASPPRRILSWIRAALPPVRRSRRSHLRPVMLPVPRKRKSSILRCTTLKSRTALPISVS